MSNPRYYWYDFVKKSIKRSKDKKDTGSQAVLIRGAISETIEETLKLEDGSERMYAINAILIDKDKSYDEVAMKLYKDRRTVQGWINSFVNMVGRKAGY